MSWGAQSLFIRLLTLVDDAGRYDGRLPVFWAHCFASFNADTGEDRQVSQSMAQEWLVELEKKSLVEIYVAEGKTVLQINQWRGSIRNPSKWPPARELAQVSQEKEQEKHQTRATQPRESYTKTPATAVELPVNFPKTIEEAQVIASMNGVLPSVCTMAWSKAVSRGGRDAKDVQIRNFAAFLQIEQAYHHDRKSRDKPKWKEPQEIVSIKKFT